MVRGDVNPLLRRLAELDVRDIAISTPDVEDLFFRYYDGSVVGSDGRAAPATADGADSARAIPGGVAMTGLTLPPGAPPQPAHRLLAGGHRRAYGGIIAPMYPILKENAKPRSRTT